MSIFMLIFMIGDLPLPTFMMLGTHPSLRECKAAIAEVKNEQYRARMTCIQLVKVTDVET